MSRITKDGVVYVKAGEFTRVSGVNKRTLRYYAQKGIIQTVRDKTTPNTHYYYRLDEAEKIKVTSDQKRYQIVCYARIPLNGDKNLLGAYIKHFEKLYPSARIITEITDDYNECLLMDLIKDMKTNFVSEFIIMKECIPEALLRFIRMITENYKVALKELNY